MTSRFEQIFTSLYAILTVLRNDSNLVTLLITLGPGIDDPRLRNEVFSLVNKAWDEIFRSVEKQMMKNMLDKAKQSVEDLHRPGS